MPVGGAVHRRRFGSAWIASAAICGLMVAGTAPAFATSEPSPDSVADTVAAVAPVDLEAVPLDVSDGYLTAAPGEGGEIAAGVDATDGLTFTPAEGTRTTTVGLPGAATLGDAVVSDDGSITYSGDAATPSLNVLTAADAVRVSTVISSAEQGTEFVYDFGVDATVEIHADGSAIVDTDADEGSPEPQAELIVADIAAPWATDAAGAPVETYYVAEGGVMTQVVNHRKAAITYPVVADPTFDSPNVVQVRVRFNRAETASIAAGGWGGVIGSFSCGAMAAVCVLASGTLVYQAGIAQNSKPKRCVQITATSPVIIPGIYWWVDTYSGGRCR